LVVLAHACFFGAYAMSVNLRQTTQALNHRGVSAPGGRVW
jgi:hypothetical protein